MNWRRLFKRKPPAPRDWSVVQELLPFGLRTEKSGLTEKEAIERSYRSKYLIAMETSEVERINKKYEDPEVFDEYIRNYHRRDW